MTSRRQFMMTVVPAAAALSMMGRAAHAADKATETEPAAVGLGYKLDATKVDAKKFPTYKAGSNCGNCNFFQGKAGDAFAACPLLGGKLVSGKGWCSGYAKKA
ncbi:high-potential iron-sulfur protein [Aquabacterium sp.]|uniref:high-potential iron-sulfur protein n=1 Tax=Aquabacterium sp. TaxID=1872578 RepID=UPI0035B33D9A